MCEVIFTVSFAEKVRNKAASGGRDGHALGFSPSQLLTFDPGKIQLNVLSFY